MVTPRTLEVANAILNACAERGHELFLTHSCRKAMQGVSPSPSEAEVRIAANWLVEIKMVTSKGDNSSYHITAKGLAAAGNLEAYVRDMEEKEDAAHQAHLATTAGVRNAKITAWVAIVISLVAAVVSYLKD